jgi:hypothetical protein
MKTILYVFAIGWFLAGLVALLGGQTLWMGTASQELAPASGPLSAAGIGWEWIWSFPMPALLAGALAAVLGRLDDIREAIEFSSEPNDDDVPEPEAGNRTDPYIDESYLQSRPEETPSPPRKSWPHF